MASFIDFSKLMAALNTPVGGSKTPKAEKEVTRKAETVKTEKPKKAEKVVMTKAHLPEVSKGFTGYEDGGNLDWPFVFISTGSKSS